MSTDEITGSLVAITTQKAFGHFMIHVLDSHEAKSLTWSNTAIRACHTAQKRCLLKAALSNSTNFEGVQY